MFTLQVETGLWQDRYGTRQKKVSGLSVSTSKVRTVLPTVLCAVWYLAALAQFFGRSMVCVKKSL